MLFLSDQMGKIIWRYKESLGYVFVVIFHFCLAYKCMSLVIFYRCWEDLFMGTSLPCFDFI